MPASFSIATISAGHPALKYHIFTMAVMQKQAIQPRDDVTLDEYHIRRSGPYLDVERHRCVEWFLNETTSDYLLFIDDDVASDNFDLPYEIVARSAADGLALTSGVYSNFFDVGKRPVVYWILQDEDGDDYFDLVTMKELREATTTQRYVEVGAVGAGFMAIHRDLLYSMIETFGSQTPTFAEFDYKNVHIGEDLGFCARTVRMGHPPCVYPDIQLDHHKSCVINCDET